MAKWCRNILTLPNCDIAIEEALKDYLSTRTCQSDDGEERSEVFLDLEKVTPYPQCIKESMPLYEGDRKNNREAIRQAERKNKEQCGYESYRDWCIENWGTIFNCGTGCRITFKAIMFETASSPPLPVISELALFTGRSVRLVYIEEYAGFCGEVSFYKDRAPDQKTYSINDAPDALMDELAEW